MDSHQEMIAEIEAETAETAALTGRTRLSPRLRAALAKVRRDAFVPGVEAPYAYVNRPLPIGHGQTISQPFIVAIMTELLDLEPDDVVLEIGTGSGYQAAILAELARRVYTIEVIPELAAAARAALQREGYSTIELRCGDGALGWPEHAPFDAIIVTAAAPEIPAALFAQLKPGGRMIAPVGPHAFEQRLVLIVKDRDGRVAARDVMAVAFVPLKHSAQSGHGPDE
jgi:protein-L-isoaspartate(D-aspartate) O-methyltransferase